MMDPWYTQRESAAGGSRWWGDRLPLWSRRIEIFPGWPRYRADKWSFSSDLGGTTEYNFRPLGTEVFLLLSCCFLRSG